MNDPNPTVDDPGREPRPEDSVAPAHIGRYRIENVLGRGGFGLVYLAHDDQLQRLVAIKVPHHTLVDCPEAAEAYLTEARTVANLDHPNIVPVHDVGSTDEIPCYVVSKYIDGTDLANRLKQSRLSTYESVEMVATVAEALHHAHKQGLVHRDIKPGNILLDRNGKPFVADFGLALCEQDIGKGPGYAGTPAYMSPEQAQGEGHRVDGRSDVFNLGVVFYELLTGRRPFHADTAEELREQITRREVRPPRQWDDTIPKELERVCLKALSKRASERYTTAKDMADDLRHFLEQSTQDEREALRSHDSAAGTSPVALASTPLPSPVSTPASDRQMIRIVPKGLRSFDAGDADFFLELLPGPRDRDGLPDSIRFWKTRIEKTDTDNTFAVGLIYGPSGCGKSSLVQAGLLPRLAENVIAIDVEATAEETETRLLNALRRQCPTLPSALGLAETLAALRRGQGIPNGKKVLIVLDQFEQWLHAKKEEENTELVGALRQCDRGRVQCIVMVRDDFWMAVTRFLTELEIDLLQGRNCAAVDLFDLDHARKVLAAFGRAFGKLPESGRETSKDQKAFLKQAVSGLAQEGKVISVRLALFAEMMKGKTWTPGTLTDVGGSQGVGVTFLEETFSSPTANPKHRLHQKAARAVLKALLPESGSDIKGHMRSQQDLRSASGYAGRPRDFDDLLRILDSEVRLITPTDPEGKDEADPSTLQSGQKYYQLTHDYLVPSLRDWLTRKQKETRKGRAELLLVDRAAVWSARPENRQLPSLLRWLQIRWHSSRKTWTPPQRKMMARAGCYHALRGLMAVVLLALIGWGVNEGHGTLKAHALRDRLLDANISEVPAIVEDMRPYRRWLNRLLHDSHAQATKDQDRPKQLRTSLALLPVDTSQVEYLRDRLLDAEPTEVAVIRDALVPHQDVLVGPLWPVVEAPSQGAKSQRLRAAAGLAAYDPESKQWAKTGALVVRDLVRESPVYLRDWEEAFQPVKSSLLAPLRTVFENQQPGQTAERSLATNLLADYAAGDAPYLADLLMDADDKQFAVIYAKVKEQGEKALTFLTAEIDKKVPAGVPSSDGTRETLAKRQANAAVALLRLGRPEKVWTLLRRTPPDDPRMRSYLIHRLSSCGAEAGAIVRRLNEEPDVTIRRALVLSLGEYSEEQLPATVRTSLLPKLQCIYAKEPDAGLHASVEWLLRRWGQEGWLRQVNEEWAKNEAKRATCVAAIRDQAKASRAAATSQLPSQWYVNGQGQTMVVIPGPVEFLMGSPPTEDGRQAWESQHRRRIGRTYALAAKPVTVREFRRFVKGNQLETWFDSGGQAAPLMKRYAPDEGCPSILVDWYRAAEYCNWLSRVEGIAEDQWCYMTNGRELTRIQVSALVRLLLPQAALAESADTGYLSLLLAGRPEVTALKKGHLSLRGYRLPTEAEMEYACRAGAVTSRYYGETEELLAEYDWYQKNSKDRSWPVGVKKPNDLGLFDMHGNVWNWCQETYNGDYSVPKGGGLIEDKEDRAQIVSANLHVVRGGSFSLHASYVRCAIRNWIVPSSRDHKVGFRPARTFTP